MGIDELVNLGTVRVLATLAEGRPEWALVGLRARLGIRDRGCAGDLGGRTVRVVAVGARMECALLGLPHELLLLQAQGTELGPLRGLAAAPIKLLRGRRHAPPFACDLGVSLRLARLGVALLDTSTHGGPCRRRSSRCASGRDLERFPLLVDELLHSSDNSMRMCVSNGRSSNTVSRYQFSSHACGRIGRSVQAAG